MPGSAPSESTILRRLKAGKIQGVKQFQIGGVGQWYIEDKGSLYKIKNWMPLPQPPGVE
jgi:hypothetical protein